MNQSVLREKRGVMRHLFGREIAPVVSAILSRLSPDSPGSLYASSYL